MAASKDSILIQWVDEAFVLRNHGQCQHTHVGIRCGEARGPGLPLIQLPRFHPKRGKNVKCCNDPVTRKYWAQIMRASGSEGTGSGDSSLPVAGWRLTGASLLLPALSKCTAVATLMTAMVVHEWRINYDRIAQQTWTMILFIVYFFGLSCTSMNHAKF